MAAYWADDVAVQTVLRRTSDVQITQVRGVRTVAQQGMYL